MARKAPAPKSAEKPRKSKLTVVLDAPTLARLSAYAAFRREQISQVVVRAVQAELKASGFVVYQGVGESPPAPVVEDGPQETRQALPGGPPHLRAV